jgi:hypothetical protein
MLDFNTNPKMVNDQSVRISIVDEKIVKIKWIYNEIRKRGENRVGIKERY